MSELHHGHKIPDTMTYTDEERALARQKQQEVAAAKKKRRNKILASIAGGATLIGGGVVAGLSLGGGGGSNSSPDRPSVSADAKPGAKVNITKLDVVPFANGALDTANEEDWGNMVNQGLISQMDWYFNALLDNPMHMDEVPTDTITSNPASEVIRDMKSAAQKIVDENPGAVDIMGVVAPIATEKYGSGYEQFSSFVSDPENYPGLSTLALDYSVQTKDNAIHEEPAIAFDIQEPYKIVQVQDGSIRIN